MTERKARVIALYPEGLGRKTALRYVRREALRLADPERTPYEFLDNSASPSPWAMHRSSQPYRS